MKYFFASTLFTLLLSTLVFVPIVVQAVDGQSLGLFPCTGVVKDGDSDPNNKECTFNDVVKLVDRLVNAGMIIILLISPLLIVRAGYHYVMSANNPGERKKANTQLLNLVIGMLIIAGSYTVVKLVLDTLIGQTNISSSNIPF